MYNIKEINKTYFMFDGIHRPDGYAKKPDSASWAQPVTEVHTSDPTVSKPKIYHPQKPSIAKPTFMNKKILILVLALVALLLSALAYWWWSNRNYQPENQLPPNNIVTEKEQPEENEELEKVPDLAFPDDYLLSEEEMPAGVSIGSMGLMYQVGSPGFKYLYKDINLENVSSTITMPYDTENNDLVVLTIVTFNNVNDLDIEEEKIKKTVTNDIDYLSDGDTVVFFRHEDKLLFIISNEESPDVFGEITNLYKEKLNTDPLNIVEGKGVGLGYRSAIKASLAMLFIPAETYYEGNASSYLGFCEDSVVDAPKEVINKVSEFYCFDEDGSWAAAAKFNDSYWCVDSNSARKEISSIPSSAGCIDEEQEDYPVSEIDVEQEEQFNMCYFVINPDDLDYYPSVAKKDEYVSLVASMDPDETEEYISNYCSFVMVNDAAMIERMELIRTDQDEDGLGLYFEDMFGSSDEKADTDEDGYDDITEIENGYSPIDNLSTSTEALVEEDEEVALAEQRNAQRQTDVNIILNAIYQYYVDNSGVLPAGILEDQKEICTSDIALADCGNLVWLGELLEDEKYLSYLPKDPSGECADKGICYEVKRSIDDKVTVIAPHAELDTIIIAEK